jgi:pimeloyl-ACP methyl ester carboxylesterase
MAAWSPSGGILSEAVPLVFDSLNSSVEIDSLRAVSPSIRIEAAESTPTRSSSAESPLSSRNWVGESAHSPTGCAPWPAGDSLEREYEDVAAVVAAVAAASGEQVDVYGHSHGGIVAFGAATLTGNIRRLVLYEGWPVPDPSIYALPADVVRRMDKLLAEGDRDGVVEALFRSVEEMSDEDMAALRRAPSWPVRVAAAHTVTREILGATRARLDAEQAAKISVPVLLLIGEKSTDPASREVGAVAAALPDARLLVLAGQRHIANILDPENFAKHLLEFLHRQARRTGGLSG